MPSLIELLSARFADAFAACGVDRTYGQVVVSQRPDLGQFQVNGALPAAGRAKRSPRDLATCVVEHIADDATLADVSIAGPGFINLTLTDEALAAHMARMADDPRLTYDATDDPTTTVLDFGGPNVAKPMHIGHLRAAIIGDALQRLFRHRGDAVTSDVHLGDWGLQMGMLITELERRRPELPYFDPDHDGPYPDQPPVTIDQLAEMYPVVSARTKDDPAALAAARQATLELQAGRRGYRALWQHFVDISVAALERDYAELGVHFDLWMGESDVQPRIPALLEQLEAGGHAVRSEGALVVPLDEADEELPPLILEKSDGGYLYGTTDLATIDHRVEELDAEQILYVVDSRQRLHFKQVFHAARETGIAPEPIGLEHLGFGTMNGPDGKPFKTREGGVMRLADLIQMVTAAADERIAALETETELSENERATIARQVGLAALKFADLSNHRTTDYVFDLERFTSFEGRTGPYVLYTAVRIRSLFRKAEAQDLTPGEILPPTADEARALMLQLAQLPEAIDKTIEDRAPNHLCEYTYELALSFNRFYHTCHILREGDSARQASWLALCALTLRALEQLAELLGMELPERM